jgi:hypothetical protein
VHEAHGCVVRGVITVCARTSHHRDQHACTSLARTLAAQRVSAACAN